MADAQISTDSTSICAEDQNNTSAPDDAVQETSECTRTAPNIQAIDKKSVHRICSGQVVLTLATAVKELVENSIDAGATSVEVRLKDYGSESIEVIDNGSGVEERNFEGLTLKHHTSKLQDFDDLINVSTFGFRGEALSSLCALSNLIITTRHKSAAVATKLEFDLNGRITGRKSVPRQVGTTVLVQNIFFTLPVRHKEFHRVLKKEFAKLVQVLNAYCIVNTGVRISCSNQTAKGSRSTLVSTNGNEYIKENIANVFSPKQLQSLLEFRQMEPQDDVFSEFGIKPEQKCAVKFRIEGFVSKCEHGQGRSSTDRQFIFINKRPCDAAKILKLINEVYHMYNRHQNPFIALNICMDKESVDVNVTPDKRQIFMEGERLLLAVLKSSLIQMFEPTTSVYKVNTFVSSSQPYLRSSSSETDSPRIPFSFKSECQSNKELHESDGPSLSSSLSRLKRSFSSAFARNDSSSSTTASPSKKNSLPSSLSSARSNSLPSQFSCSDRGSITHFLSRFSPKKSPSLSPHTSPAQAKVRYESRISGSPEKEAIVISPILSMGDTERQRLSFENPYPQPAGVDGDVETDCEVFTVSSSDLSNNNLKPVNRNSEASDIMEQPEHFEVSLIKTFSLSGQKHENFSEVNSNSTDQRDAKNSGLVISFHDGSCTKELPVSPTLANCSRQSHEKIDDCEDETDGGDDEKHRKEMSMEDSTILTDRDFQEDGEVERQKKERMISFSFTDLRKRMEALKVKTSEAASSFSRSFRAKICPGDNKSAEDELQREISKDMFARMKILGQFNLGFIITKLGSDLFIVDQHATDEKYNFEMLQRHTVLKSQRMILPQSLELTASNETILVDNLEVFKKNGFDFTIDPEAPPTQRVKLISAPVSKNWSFGKDDIEELLFMLTDSPNVMCRPSRVRMMFASRACRKSIMIGTALNKAEMKRLVCHMGEIEQPWNCPHGRPTMRHLFNMDMLPS